MYKATRQLLKDRPKSKFTTVEKIKVSDAVPNMCLQNSISMCEKDENLMVVSGWLVGEFMGDQGTAIIPHYWVRDLIKKKDFDPTPVVGDGNQKYEYVEDGDIFNYGKKDCYLPTPLRLLGDGTYKACLLNGTLISISSPDVLMLYSLQHSK